MITRVGFAFQPNALKPTGVNVTGFPKIEIVEEAMREGMQIESAAIPVSAKVELLDALSGTGLRSIVVGSLVSPKWTPQMAEVEQVIERFTPQPGVRYTALALNDKGRERLARFIPPLEPTPLGPPRSLVHVCDVFVRRNLNRSQHDEIAALPDFVKRTIDTGATTAGIGLVAAFGSNWLGPFSQSEQMDILETQARLWEDAGLPVSFVYLGDSMGWNVPTAVSSLLRAIRNRWTSITTFHLHLHNARGSAPVSAYAAIGELDERHTLIFDTSVGGMGGCPYCGHGRATKMIPTEDLVDLLEEMGIDTGVDLDRLIEVAWLAERVVGHELWGHVSKAGPRPRGRRLYAMDMPFIETTEQAQHFRLGPETYAPPRSPWREPITSPRREAADREATR